MLSSQETSSGREKICKVEERKAPPESKPRAGRPWGCTMTCASCCCAVLGELCTLQDLEPSPQAPTHAYQMINLGQLRRHRKTEMSLLHTSEVGLKINNQMWVHKRSSPLFYPPNLPGISRVLHLKWKYARNRILRKLGVNLTNGHIPKPPKSISQFQLEKRGEGTVLTVTPSVLELGWA